MKKEQRTKIASIILSAIFNVVDVCIIIFCGLVMKVKIELIISILLLFFIARITSNKQMHYKSPVKCAIWSTLLCCTFFLLTKVDVLLALLITIMEGILLTGKGDVRNGLMYYNKDENSKYREVIKYIKENIDEQSMETYEQILRILNEKYSERYKIDFYKIFQLKFIEGNSFQKIIEKTNLNNNDSVTEVLDIIAMSFNTYIETKKIIEEKEKELTLM